MVANLFSRLERFREESQVMATHWFSGRSLKLIIISHSLTDSDTQSLTRVGIELLGQLKMKKIVREKMKKKSKRRID